ncbi:plant cysteine oxidase 3 isoform X1 [Cryptomeria japonica]|uniref:plant cysteine oxidase 3 isoform X1 n=1 Tax=Cryptomeria japonica TaxID=3369 RepID=UPI0027DA7B47|nr:plant cysteine oxidase 3 isoform X1 [Cryptomeria japonica]
MQTSSLVQALFDLCKKAFLPSGPAPSPAAINKLCSLLDTFKPIDVGLNEDALEQDRGYGFFGQNIQRNRHSAMVARWSQPVTYLHIYECDSFTIGIFCLPTSAVIPLHDHPGMIVLSKLLYGSMHVKAYDWVDPVDLERNSDRSQSRLAKLKVDTVITAPRGPSVLYPTTGGNIHSFTAVTSCAVLDVLAPPYSDTAGRHCTYYRDYPYSCFPGKLTENTVEDQGYAWLEVDSMNDFFVRGGKYTGPRVET